MDGAESVCVFVNDRLDAPCLEQLHRSGVRLVTLRCAGFNNVDLATAKVLGLAVTRVPSGALVLKPSALTFNTVAGTADPASQTISVTAPFDTLATVKVTQQSCIGSTWLTVSPTGSSVVSTRAA